MGGIYPKPEKSAPNSRNGSGFPNDNQQLNESNFSNVFHPNTLGSTSRASHNDYSGVFARTLASGLPNNQSSFSIPGQRPNNKSCEDIVNYRYMADSGSFQPRNMSISPNTILQSQLKHQNFNQANLMSTLSQNRSAAVLQQLSAVAKNEPFQGPQMMQSGSKLNVDVSNRSKPTNYPQQHSHQSGIFPPNKRPQLISQPPHKRSRLTNDFVNMTHHSPNNIQQGHHLTMNQQDNIRLSSSPQKFCPKDNIYKGSMMNQPKSNLLDHRGIWQNKEPAYYPQVEAISPVPEDMRHCDFKTLTEKDDIGEKLSVVNADIIKQEQNISRLQEKIESLNSKINEPCIETDSKEETIITTSRDPIQSIITDNQRKATEQHQLFHKLCSTHVSWGPLALPLYRQQGDVDLLVEVKAHFNKTFKPHLIKYIRRRKFAEKARIRFLADSYQVASKAWYKRLDKTLNSAKRRQKESKFRELFEKTFPEIKRNREERERENGDYNETASNTVESSSNVSSAVNNHRCLNNSFNVSSATDNQRPTSPYDAVKEMEKMKEYAIDPPLTTSTWYKSKNLIEYGSLVKDPKSQHNNFQDYKLFWSREEIDIFKEQYIITPKNFARIASLLSKKSVSDCVHYYYLTKKSLNYKSLVKKHARRRRDKAERQHRYNQAHHNTGDTIIPQTSDSIEGAKMEPLLSKNFIEFSTLLKEEQRNNMYNQDNDSNQEVPKEHGDNKGNCTMEDNKSSSSTVKNNKNNGSSCSERNSLSRSRREPDNDDEDDNYRRHFTSEFSRDSDAIRTFESIRMPSNENERNKISDNNCENEFNCSRQLSDMPNISIGTKHESIHIKEAIEYSIEQNLSQNPEKNFNKGLDKKLYQGAARALDSTFEFPRLNIDESMWKKNNTIDNVESNSKYGYFQSENENTPAFLDANRESRNSDSPMRFNSSVNRAILMKDFCTAQMMNQIPLSSSVNSKLQPMSYPASTSEHCIDPSRSIAPEQLPIPEPYKQKMPSTTESIDPYINNISALSKATNPSMKKSDFFIDRVSKLYEEEVEPYTDEFRNRSDSQRTRTSSEASEMYAYIKIRNQKNIPSSKRIPVTHSSNEKTTNTTVDSRIKMPPPDVTDQKVFRTQKLSFSSKNPYLKSNLSKEGVLANDSCQHNKSASDEVSSVASNCSESNLKRKIITAANIIDSLIDKHTTNDNDVKVLSNSYKTTPEKSFAKVIDLSDDKFNQINSFKNTSQMTLDGHIKQLIVDDYDSTRRSDQSLQNSGESGRGAPQSKHEMVKHKYQHAVPLKKRDKAGLPDYSSPSRVKVSSKSFSECSNGSASRPTPEKNNNTIAYKDKLDYSVADSYDSQSPQFNSPGKLLIDLDNTAEGF